jgi:hypothetical protein
MYSFPGLEKDNFQGHTLKSVNVHFQILIISWIQLINSLLSVIIVEKLMYPIKRINPLLTTDNPVPIPGCHTPEVCSSQ